MTFIYNKIMKLGTVGLIAAGVLAGCASTESKMAVPYIVELNADSQVNPNASGKPSPVKVTVYELKSTNAFDTADYFALMKDPRAVLGDQMLEVNSRIIKPAVLKKSSIGKHPGQGAGHCCLVPRSEQQSMAPGSRSARSRDDQFLQILAVLS